MEIIWSESQWLGPGLLILGVVAIGLFFSYRINASIPLATRWFAGILKILGFALLLAFIINPKQVQRINPPGVNHWAILVDTSASMTLKDQDDSRSRADRLRALLPEEPQAWRSQLEKDFLVDSYRFDERVGLIQPDTPLSFDGAGSSLGQALDTLKNRYQGRPLAGIMVLTDGSPTDSVDATSDLPPVFPVVFTPERPLQDLAISNIIAQDTLFEDAPLIIDVSVTGSGLAGRTFQLSIHEIDGDRLAVKTQKLDTDSDAQVIRFQVKPQGEGVVFLEARVALDTTDEIVEATLENNRRLLTTNREAGPYRVLYLAGRPNFEHKFLQRALDEDATVSMTSLLRIARREPKFDYRGREGETSNPLYRGFGDQEEAERFDEPVFLRLRTAYPGELAGGFPRTPEELFPFEAVIIDDVEADFFDYEQMRLLQRYVTERGGSLMMLGGMESLDMGAYADTPIGAMLPVTLESGTPLGGSVAGRFALTREGRLEPWLRLRDTEEEEQERIQNMPTFPNVHVLSDIRPGAMSVGELDTEFGPSPALAVRRYGRGRTAVLALTDLWRWGLQETDSQKDMGKAWRQMIRWLLADVPRPLTIEVESQTKSGSDVSLTTTVLGNDFQPDESGSIQLHVRRPDNTWTQLSTDPHPEKMGVQTSTFKTSTSGAYLAEARLLASAEFPAMAAQTGWVVNTLQDEFASMEPDMPAMQKLAESTGGQVVKPEDLNRFVDDLDKLPLPVEETRAEPLMSSPLWLILALAAFIGEWALRRGKQLP